MAREAEVKIAYVPFKTFLTALDTLRQGIPDPLDRSVFRGQSGSTQSMLISSLKALGCVDDADHPQPVLARLVDGGQRKSALEEVLRDKYQGVLGLGLTATQQQFDNAFREYGVSGDTHKKAKSFFLQAAHMVGLKLSPYVGGARVAGGENTSPPRAPRRRKRTSGPASPGSPDQGSRPSVGIAAGGSTKSVALKGGAGTVTLTVSINPYELDDADQNFVFGLIKSLKEYEKANTPAPPAKERHSFDNVSASAPANGPGES